MLLKNMPMLLEKTGEQETRSHLLPMIISSIDFSHPQLQVSARKDSFCINVTAIEWHCL